MSINVSKKMLINVMHPEETRVAIVHDGRLMELNIEISGKEQIKGNIYKGIVLRVEPGLQAAFVDIGRTKPGFLQMGELHSDFWQWRDDLPEEQRKKYPRIQEVLHRGQELLVQVEKDERDNKGSALTTYISLPGRYMVMMPGSDSAGISRKIEQESVRKKLKEIVAEMEIPDGIGYIMRTEAVGRTPEELQKDFSNLTDLYESIKLKASEIKNAGEIYRDSGLIIRTIRDYFSDDVDEILVDSKEAYREAKDFFRNTMPTYEKRVKLHKEKRPIFSRFQLEEQIDQIYEKKVPLPSGGSLIIEPTEALVSIDVNSGKSSGERGIEDTAFNTNIEAAEEVARQLRLRDLGGLIMIDFIDMRENRHNIEVEKTLKNALKMDKARVNVGRISQFGVLEMSRQRIAKTLNDAIHLECPHCEGRGKVKSVEAMAVSFLRKVHASAAKGTVAEVRGGLPLEVAYYLLNRKKRELTQIENDYEIEVTVKGKTSFLLNQLELETIRRAKPHVEDVLKSEAEAEEAHKTSSSAPAQKVETESEEKIEPIATTEGTKKRKRRKKKKKPSAEPLQESNETTASEAVNDEMAESDEATAAAAEAIPLDAPDSSTDQPLKPKKKKRRRSRSKGSKESEVANEESSDNDAATIPPPPASEIKVGIPSEATAPAETKTKRTRKAGKKKTEQAETEKSETTDSIESNPEPVKKQPSKKKPRAAAAKAQAYTEVTELVEESPPAKVVKPKSVKKGVVAKKAKSAIKND
ncbi:MAG: Rne/Rng family ribonuclease [Desulfuromonadaceae bacterium]|nr:Rne/Rng family ribonuclease [Desulfuromonadaceae bacterium]MDD2854390.1 Rne/Rng family ribonuclease [Desulfuromonadaceae bacterium]